MLTIETIRQHCRIDGTADDALLLLRAKAVEQMAEQETGRTFTERTRVLRLPSWPAGGLSSAISLPGVPVKSITSVTYLDSAGERQTLDPSAYRLSGTDVESLEALLWAPDGWPATKCEPGSIVITYVAGYGAAEADIPESARAWLLLHIAHLTRNPEAATDKAMTALPYADGLIDWMRVYR